MEITILFLLLSISFIYLLVTSFILLRNRLELTELVDDTLVSFKSKKISVCIPARNEEDNIGQLLDTLLDQTYENFEVQVLNDHSTDRTSKILNRYQKAYPAKLTVHAGKIKPNGWLGKPWACQQLGEAATGELLLFLDADTQLKPGALSKINTSFQYYHLDMLSVWPRQIFGTFWERCVIPLIYYTLLTVLPTIYVYRKPRWMPVSIYHKFSDKFAVANGQCIAFHKEAYDTIGGHQPVKDKVVEDVELAKVSKKAGLHIRMFTGMETIRCRMYRSEKEMFEGLRKNFLAGFGNSLTTFLSAAFLHLIVFVLPFLTWFHSNPAIAYLAVASVTLIFAQRLVLSVWFNWDPLFVFTHPLGVLWFQRLGGVKIIDRIAGRKTSWKGREV